MNKLIRSAVLMLMVVSLLCLDHSLAFAKKPSDTPHGWTKGKKTGWHGANKPPGLSKKEIEKSKKKSKKTVKEEVDEMKESVTNQEA